MPDSTEFKNKNSRGKTTAAIFSVFRSFIPRPATMGSFVILITVLAFLAGWIRNELAITLLGTVFLCILAYCFLAVFLLGVIHRRKAGLLSLVIVSETVNAGTEGELFIKTGGSDQNKRNRFWSLPAVLIRCELCLETKDGRVIRHYAKPGAEKYSSFPVKERGAYYGKHGSRADSLRTEGLRSEGRLIIFDAPGFFRLPIPAGNKVPPLAGPRLFAVPRPAEELIPVSLRYGGTEQRNEPHYRKSDDLTDHRPYVPGDDPRRINWKLYGHAVLGDLLVREGEPEPPPHSRLLILIDTEADRSLYTIDEGRRVVDLLCESALTMALDFSLKGMDIKIGYTQVCSSGAQAYSTAMQAYSSGTGGTGTGDQRNEHRIIGADAESGPLNAAELAAALAWPAAIFTPSAAGETFDLPKLTNQQISGIEKEISVLILALPRKNADESALDRFLKNRGAQGGTDVVFVYEAEQKNAGPGTEGNQKNRDKRTIELEEAVRVCVNLYNRKAGTRAAMAAVSAANKIETPVNKIHTPRGGL